MDLINYNKLEVHLGALRANIKTALKLLGKNNFFYPFVKVQRLRLGPCKIASILEEEGLHEIGVLTVQEAQALSSSNIKILIFGPAENTEAFLKHPHWIPVISSFDDLKTFSQTMAKHLKVRPVHIKFDVGFLAWALRKKTLIK